MITVADVETTGDNCEVDQICELGLVFLDQSPPQGMIRRWPVAGTFDALCGITVPMDPRARATHHIDPTQLAGLLNASETLLLGWQGGAQYLAAHMAEFDAGFLGLALRPLGLSLPPVVCTYRCALHLYPDAPAYGLQVLRYWLDLDVGPLPPGQHQHRALYDALVCAALLRRMLEQRSINELVALTIAPVLLKTCRYEAHRGKPWAEVPVSYLRWMNGKGEKKPGSDSGFDRDTIYTVQYWLASHQLKSEAERVEREERQAAAAEAHRLALAAQAAQHRQQERGDVPDSATESGVDVVSSPHDSAVSANNVGGSG